jgi:hypothetical protein
MEASMLMFVGAWRYRCQKMGKVFAGGLWLDVWCLSEDRAIKTLRIMAATLPACV